MQTTTTRVRTWPMEEKDYDDVLAIDRVSNSNPWNRDDLDAYTMSQTSKSVIIKHHPPSRPATTTGFLVYYLFNRRIVIRNIAVHPDFRFFGMGRTLIEEVKTSLTAYRHIIQVNVPERNLEAQLFFRRVGFEWITTSRNEDELDDTYVMQLTTKTELKW